MTTRTIRIVGGSYLGLVLLITPSVVDSIDASRAERQALVQRGVGGQRGRTGIGGRRGEPMPGERGRRGRPGMTESGSRVELREYDFPDTGERLEYAVFVSTKVKPDKKAPLVIGLHGLGTPPAIWLSRIADAAQDAGYIVAAPTGYNLTGWYGANGPGTGRGTMPNIGELSERDVLNVLGRMRSEFNIDDRRIYLAGHSMGGAGALHLGIKHKDIWAAVGASAPAIRTEYQKPADLERAREMPMILIHGDADTAVHVSGSRLWAEKMKALEMTYEYREIHGGTHGDTLERAARDMFKFFDKYVKPDTFTFIINWPTLAAVRAGAGQSAATAQARLKMTRRRAPR